MRLNDKTVVHTLLESTITTNDLVIYFDSIIILLKKHRRNIQSSTIADIIKKIDPTLYTVIEILLLAHKCTISDIKELSKIVKQSDTTYKKIFDVALTKDSVQYKTIEKELSTKFPESQITQNANEDLGAYVHGEWRYYKRNIDQDLQKMLG